MRGRPGGSGKRKHNGNQKGGAGRPGRNDIHAPYNFVPVSAFVHLPEWGAAVSQDQPFEDGLSGTLNYRIVAHSQILIAAGDSQGDEEGDIRTAPFFELPDGRPAIPGSTVRGLLRNVLEIASFSRMSLVDDRRFGVRDLTRNAQFYMNRMTRKRGQEITPLARSGWLKLDRSSGSWRIEPCRYARVEHDVLIRDWKMDGIHVTKDENAQPGLDWRKQALDGHGLVCWFAPPVVSHVRTNSGKTPFDLVMARADGIFRSQDDARNAGAASPTRGHLVFTGSVANRKHREFIFHKDPGDQQAEIEVPPGVVARFLDIHDEKLGRHDDESAQWPLWRRKLLSGEIGPGSDKEPGIPVFYLGSSATPVEAIGLASMFKLPYEYGVADMLDHVSDRHRPPCKGCGNAEGCRPDYDMAEMLFGTVRRDAAFCNLKGRVSFGLARLSGDIPERPQLPTRTVLLNAPKPSYYPAYVRQRTGQAFDADGDRVKGPYRTYMADGGRTAPEIRGWKRYWTRQAVDTSQKLPDPDPPQERARTCTVLRPLPEGSVFEGRIRFHNLRPEELGALLWALAFGEDPAADGARSCHHTMGMGKPFGYGQCSLVISDPEILPNRTERRDGRPRRTVLADRDAHATMRQAMDRFALQMEQAYRTAAGGNQTNAPGWLDSPQIRALRTMASAGDQEAGGHRRSYMTLDPAKSVNEFAGAKGNRQKNTVARSLAPPLEGLLDADEAMFGRPGVSDDAWKAEPPEWLRVVDRVRGDGSGKAGPAPARPPLTDREQAARRAALNAAKNRSDG